MCRSVYLEICFWGCCSQCVRLKVAFEYHFDVILRVHRSATQSQALRRNLRRVANDPNWRLRCITRICRKEELARPVQSLLLHSHSSSTLRLWCHSLKGGRLQKTPIQACKGRSVRIFLQICRSSLLIEARRCGPALSMTDYQTLARHDSSYMSKTSCSSPAYRAPELPTNLGCHMLTVSNGLYKASAKHSGCNIGHCTASY